MNLARIRISKHDQRYFRKISAVSNSLHTLVQAVHASRIGTIRAGYFHLREKSAIATCSFGSRRWNIQILRSGHECERHWRCCYSILIELIYDSCWMELPSFVLFLSIYMRFKIRIKTNRCELVIKTLSWVSFRTGLIYIFIVYIWLIYSIYVYLFYTNGHHVLYSKRAYWKYFLVSILTLPSQYILF